MSIRTRLTVTYLLLTGAVILMFGIYDSMSFEGFVRESARADVSARVTAVGESVADWIERGDAARVPLVVQRYGAQDDVTVQFFDPQGAVVASSSGADTTRRAADIPGVKEALAGKASRGATRTARGAASFYEARPLIRHGRLLGVLRVTARLSAFQAQLRSNRVALLAALLGAFLVCAVVTARLAHGLARPIQRMRNFAVDLGNGAFGQRLDIARADELGQLAEQLNKMSHRLEELDVERRTFLANASHELRTPVSNVQVTLEALLQGAGEDHELRQRFLETALGETQRMSTLVQELLDLGQLEAGVMPVEPHGVGLPYLVSHAQKAMEPRVAAAEVKMRTRADDVIVAVDVSRMLRALLNIVDNALKVAPRGSTIEIDGSERDGLVTITISDEGPGIDAADLPRIFEQFYTADRSRKRGGGTGLGLAIARRIVTAHGGTLSAANRPGSGAVFTIRLPAVRGGAMNRPEGST